MVAVCRRVGEATRRRRLLPGEVNSSWQKVQLPSLQYDTISNLISLPSALAAASWLGCDRLTHFTIINSALKTPYEKPHQSHSVPLQVVTHPHFLHRALYGPPSASLANSGHKEVLATADCHIKWVASLQCLLSLCCLSCHLLTHLFAASPNHTSGYLCHCRLG